MRKVAKSIIVSIFVLSGWTTAPAMAELWSWATETAISRFSPKDIDLLKATAADALNNHPDESELSWDNPGTGHSGSVKVFGTKEIEGQTCRQTFIKNDAKTIKGSAQYFLCKQKDGKWQVTAPQ
ncbi:MAG: RT0821/Lpp0805 family surface protein [bacterium]